MCFQLLPENLATLDELTENNIVIVGNKSLNVYLICNQSKLLN